MKFDKLAGAAIAVAVAFCLGTAPAVAGGGPKSKGPVRAMAPGAATHGPVATVHGAATQGPKTTVHGSSASAHGPKTTAAHGPKTTTHGAAGTHGPKATSGQTKTATHGNPHAATGTGTTATVAGTPTHAQQLLAKNTNLRERLLTRFPAGTDINLAAAGFKNLGQFVAAVNVSNNLGIPFADLKAKMTGTDMAGLPIAGATTTSLGQAIQQLRGLPEGEATTTAQTALVKANTEIEATSVKTTTTTTTTTKAKPKTHQ
jgi:hypothetical protein